MSQKTGVDLRTLCLLVIAMLVGVVIAANWLHHDRLKARLLRTWADQVPQHADLVEFASSEARPAFRAHCAVCHGEDMQGSRRTGAPDLTDAKWIYGDGRVSEIEQTILYGVRSGDHRSHSLADMPGFGLLRPYWRYALPTLTPEEIADVTAYIRASGGKDGDPGAVRRGEAIYKGKAQCFDCHTSDARGDNFVGAPNLTDDNWLYGDGSVAAIEATIYGGRAGVCPAWSGRLSPATVRALAVYIHARAGAPDRDGLKSARS